MAIALSEDIRKLVDGPNFAHFATLMPDGSPHAIPVWVSREGDRVLTNVAFHLKGMGSFRTVDEKASFAVKFDEFVEGQEYAGLTKLMFNNASQDGTYLAEWIATRLEVATLKASTKG